MSETQQGQRVVLLTGAARGIGEAMARLFAGRGCIVVALDMLESGCVVCDEISSADGVCQFYQCDVTDEAQARQKARYSHSHAHWPGKWRRITSASIPSAPARSIRPCCART
ncbi:MAG TPA: SDR family NAD(P)-dependent oxidoreductase [Ktedonobacteraceae bacterium]|nr:SDR family NAD(P)-dependent oxidoreductase [Ktedonobacteraceae bacterium]